MKSKINQCLAFLRKNGGLARYSEIFKAGFDKSILNRCIKAKVINRIDRGIYTIMENISVSNPDLIAVSIKVPRGVICMLSALSFHEATNEIPKQIDVAIPRGTHENNITYPPVKFYHYDSKTYETGIENYDVGGRKIKIYCLARTVADCFKFRNKIGVDVARNALKIAINEKKIKPKEVMYYAKICRVENIIKPILETIL